VHLLSPSRGGGMELPLAKGKYRKSGELLRDVLGYFGMAVLALLMYLFLQYDKTRPIRPEASSEHIYAQENKGQVVFLTKTENNNKMVLKILAGSAFGISLLADILFVGDFLREKKPWERTPGSSRLTP
jgi:hypothetical protein